MSKSKLATDADLPAPLSLTLEDVRNVAGGATFAATVSAAHWWWYGQPAPLAERGLPGQRVQCGRRTGWSGTGSRMLNLRTALRPRLDSSVAQIARGVAVLRQAGQRLHFNVITVEDYP